MCRQLFRAGMLVGALLGMVQLAHADVWGYIDESGVPHFAAEQLDERYELYVANSEGTAKGEGRSVMQTPTKLLAFFDISPGYKSVKHLLREAAREHQVDYVLLQALIVTESGFDARVVSPRGAVGLMQLMPATARHYGVLNDSKITIQQQLKDPRTNIYAGTRYLQDMMARFPGQMELALAAYNSGLPAVRRAGNQVPQFKETQNYVKTVLQLYAVLKGPTLRPRASPPALIAEANDRTETN